MREPVWIDAADTLAIHELVLARYGSRGVQGVHDAARLEAALEGPLRHIAAGRRAVTDIVDLASRYATCIVRRRPFENLNAVTGLVVAMAFLELNGYRFKAGEVEAARAVLDLMAGRLGRAEFKAFLRAHAKLTWESIRTT